MSQKHPIELPLSIVKKWYDEIGYDTSNGDLVCLVDYVATKAARWGADIELKACCEWMRARGLHPEYWKDMQTSRRPPPSPKQQGLTALSQIMSSQKGTFDGKPFETLRKILEALPDD